MNEQGRVDLERYAAPAQLGEAWTKAPRVDLERLAARLDVAEREAGGVWSKLYRHEAEALLAVVDAARMARERVTPVGGNVWGILDRALEPFTPAEEEARAGDAEMVRGLLAHTEPVDARAFNERMLERERARRLAALGIEVRPLGAQAAPAADRDTAASDALSSAAGGRPTSLTGRRDSPQGSTSEPAPPPPVDALDALIRERIAMHEQRQRAEQAERELEAERTRGIDHGIYEMVCEERDALGARLARVPALVEAIQMVLEDGILRTTNERPLRAALAEWEQA